MLLSDKYTVERGSVYLTGIQALVRLPIDQMRRDRRAGLKTGAFISGYEGSPLGGYDMALARFEEAARRAQHPFQSRRQRRSGRDRHHGQPDFRGRRQRARSMAWSASGTAKVPESIAAATFSATPTWPAPGKIAPPWCLPATIMAARAPPSLTRAISACTTSASRFLYPGNVAGDHRLRHLLAIALSRFSGAWVGMKLVTDVCDGGGTVVVDPDRPQIGFREGYQKNVDARLVPPITLGLEYEVNVAAIASRRCNSRG